MDVRTATSAKAVIAHEGRVLIIRESMHEDRPGMYDLPGGRLKDDESVEDALRREVMEETGLTIEVGKQFFGTAWEAVIRGEAYHIEGAFFRCTTDSAEVRLSRDHDAYLWIDPLDF